MIATAAPTEYSPLDAEFRRMLVGSRTPKLRSMREFAEADFVLAEGPRKGHRFKCNIQPLTALFFDEVDTGRWRRVVVTGPSQASKTTIGYIVPILFHLFEMNETVIAGLPNMEMAGDKWRTDIKPAIEAGPFAKHLPLEGLGSKGGKVESIKFRNGATLKFMSAGGSDKRRAGYSARVVVITETDDLDESGGSSREADKITQLEARTRAYGDGKRIYMECTTSVATGRTWREYQAGTRSRILLPCPKCHEYVLPERENVKGWQNAESKPEAERNTRFHCPECDAPWSEKQRHAANHHGVLVHRGQKVTADGEVTGPLPLTDTLGFRWTAVHNLFLTAGDIGGDLWSAARDPDEDNAERHICQFVFAKPYQPPAMDATPLDAPTLQRRVSNTPKGMVPEDITTMTAGVDMGKRLVHYVVIGFTDSGGGQVIDYGVVEIASDQLGIETGTMIALRELRDMLLVGYVQADGVVRVPDQVLIDCNYSESKDVVYAFCREAETVAGCTTEYQRFRPVRGRGSGQMRTNYNRPKSVTVTVMAIGEEYHMVLLKSERLYLVEANVDYWKSWVHERLRIDKDSPTALTFFHALPNEHTPIAKHLTAEKKVEEMVPGKGVVVKWVVIRKANHYLDCCCYACVAGHIAGVKLVKEEPVEVLVSGDLPTPVRGIDGQAFLVTER